MRKDFCAFILTHGRPNNVVTYRTLQTHGYTGKVFIVIDDDDETADEYKRIYGDDVLVFSKDEVARYTDQFDNSSDRRGILWARNVCWDLARQQGYRYFVQLDDDYTHWHYRRLGRGHRLSTSAGEEYHGWSMRSLDAVFDALVRVIETTPVTTIALSQGGDHLGGEINPRRFKRKAMNSFVCDVDKPIRFRGRLNDDVTTYVSLGGTGTLFFTDMELQLEQLSTQSNSGGMSEVYRDSGTYAKSFYTLMAAPSCTTIRIMGRSSQRLHHHIDWNKAVPKIISERVQSSVSIEPTVSSSPLVETPPSKMVDSFLGKYDEMFPMDKPFARKIIEQLLRHRSSSKQNPLPLPEYMVALEDRWYSSLRRGEPDYTVYDDEYAFTEMWVCWAIYSRSYLRGLRRPAVWPIVEKIKTVADLGCGIGYTTGGLKELFPGGDVVGTNIEGTNQYEFGMAMGESHGFRMATDIHDLSPVDLVFATEYFEHFEEPILHLEEVLATLTPSFLYIANSFNTRSVGHFDHYVIGGDRLNASKVQKVFNKTLASRGYERLEINAWNNKPALWARRRPA